jgi:3D (Asp-Asp-Asp) domain-containing protein
MKVNELESQQFTAAELDEIDFVAALTPGEVESELRRFGVRPLTELPSEVSCLLRSHRRDRSAAGFGAIIADRHPGLIRCLRLLNQQPQAVAALLLFLILPIVMRLYLVRESLSLDLPPVAIGELLPAPEKRAQGFDVLIAGRQIYALIPSKISKSSAGPCTPYLPKGWQTGWAAPLRTHEDGHMANEIPEGLTSKREVPADVDHPVTYVATAYSLGGRTASGRMITKGLIAADPSVLPLGTRIRLDHPGYSGEYIVADTGGIIRGRRIDIFVPNAPAPKNNEVISFQRRPVKVTVLSVGKGRAQQKEPKTD